MNKQDAVSTTAVLKEKVKRKAMTIQMGDLRGSEEENLEVFTKDFSRLETNIVNLRKMQMGSASQTTAVISLF